MGVDGECVCVCVCKERWAVWRGEDEEEGWVEGGWRLDGGETLLPHLL